MQKPRGGIIKVSTLFDKYKKILFAPQATVEKAFIEVVEDVLGLRIAPEKVTYTVGTRTIFLTVGGPLKSEIVLHKEEILTHLKGRLGEKSAPKTIL